MYMMNSTCRYRPLRLGLPLCLLVSLGLGGCATSTKQQTASAVISPEAASELRLARAARSAGDFASSVNLLRQTMAEQPNNQDLRLELARTLLDSGAVDEAMDQYDQVPLGSEARIQAEIGLGRANLALDQVPAALANFDHACALKADDMNARLGRGVALDRLLRHTEAQDSYRLVLAKQPRNVAARNDLALSLALSGRYDEALAILVPLARSATATPQLHQNLALIYGLKGNLNAANALYKLDLDDPSAAINLRLFAMLHGDSFAPTQESEAAPMTKAAPVTKADSLPRPSGAPDPALPPGFEIFPLH